jgi:hypothetical protein
VLVLAYILIGLASVAVIGPIVCWIICVPKTQRVFRGCRRFADPCDGRRRRVSHGHGPAPLHPTLHAHGERLFAIPCHAAARFLPPSQTGWQDTPF